MCMGLGAYTDIEVVDEPIRSRLIMSMKMPGLAWRSEDYGDDEHGFKR